jgi:hypothetical protein
MQVIKIYKTLKYTIKCTDIGFLKQMIIYIYLYFANSSFRNYTFNILYFWRLIATDICNSVLQQAVLVNNLVNNCSKLDSFFKANYFNKLLNL